MAYFKINDGHIISISTVTEATHTLSSEEYLLHVTYTTTGAVTITIPTTQFISGREFIIKDAGNNAGTSSITIATEGSQKIEFSISDYVMSTNGESVTLYCDGTDLFIH